MRVRHPRADPDVPGVPPSKVDVNGTTVEVDESGEFDVGDNGAWVGRFARAHDVDREAVLVDATTSDRGDESDGGEYPTDLSSRSDLEALNHDELKAVAEQLNIADDVDLRSKATIVDGILGHVGGN